MKEEAFICEAEDTSIKGFLSNPDTAGIKYVKEKYTNGEDIILPKNTKLRYVKDIKVNSVGYQMFSDGKVVFLFSHTFKKHFIKESLDEEANIKKLVEMLEENEDTVECTWCNELFDKNECRYEVDLGYLCPRCEAAIKSRGETLTFRESLTNIFNPDELVDLEYKNVDAEVITDVIPATYWEPEDYKTKAVVKDFVYEVPAGEIATFIYEDLLDEEDIKDVPGGFDVLDNDDTVWQEFLNTHFDILFKKYYQKILDHFEEDAYEAAEEQFQKEYDDYAYDMKWGL